MNHLLYNISVVMLLSGLLFLTYYLSKAYNQPISCPRQIQEAPEMTIDEAYTMRPTQIFDSMFTKPSIWQGYESVAVSRSVPKK
jgi:hypothetical protein